VGGTFTPGERVVPSVLPAFRAATTRGPWRPSVGRHRRAHAAGQLDVCEPSATDRTGVRWEVYDTGVDERPRHFETAVYCLLAP